VAGALGPIGFLIVSFAMAAARPELIQAHGWKSWPSIMATGGPPASLPQTAAFLWIASCYAVFALGAVRPVLRAPVVTVSFLVIAAGDGLLAFPTDVHQATPSWHGTLHLVGVVLATAATTVAAVASLILLRGRPGWTAWRWGTAVIFLGTAAGLAGGFVNGPAKILYVVAITAPVPVLAWSVRRHADDPIAPGEVPNAATSG
jgi:Protein of unknown function (DUF998)